MSRRQGIPPRLHKRGSEGCEERPELHFQLPDNGFASEVPDDGLPSDGDFGGDDGGLFDDGDDAGAWL